jgi:hypothetical protein
MITFAHTSGRWCSDGRFITAPDPTGVHRDIYIAEIVEADDEGRLATPEQQLANSELIAAAPEMLEALELCEEVLSELARLDDGTPSVSALHMATNAIARATGGDE